MLVIHNEVTKTNTYALLNFQKYLPNYNLSVGQWKENLLFLCHEQSKFTLNVYLITVIRL